MKRKYELIVMGVSSGGLKALSQILPALPAYFPCPVAIVQHIGAQAENHWIRTLSMKCQLRITEAEEKEPIRRGYVYIAPANYHLLVEFDHTFSLSTDHRVNFARPSVDVLFESAASVYRDKVIGIVLTGANSDGALGLKRIKDAGGLAIVQDPSTADYPSMPLSAIKATNVDHTLPLNKITETLLQLQL